MRYFSVCSGIEAATVGWHRMGWKPVAFSEIEPFPAAVLKHHYPNVPNLGDMTKINGGDYRGLVDVLVGGTPCQAFSVAGLRQGLVDPRGSLTLTFAKLADDMAAPFVVWENVPGVLSSKDNAFGCFLGLLAGEDDALVAPGGKWTDAGYVLGPKRAIAWRVLDAQYFGLAQRRRRVFVVACPRNGADPREILFEREGLRRDTPPSREAREGTAANAPAGAGVGVFQLELQNQGNGGNRGFAHMDEPGFTMNTSGPQGVVSFHPTQDPISITGSVTHALKAEGFDASEDGTGRGQPMVACFGGNNTSGPIDVATARSSSSSPHGRLDFESETFAVSVALRWREGGGTAELGDDKANALLTPNGGRGGIGVGAVAIGFNGDQSEKTRSMGTVEGQSPTLRRDGPAHVAVAFPIQECHVSRANLKGTGTGLGGEGDPMFTLQSAQPHGVAQAMQVRRLTPRECERLQGFPDDYTLIPTDRAKRIEADVLAYYRAAHPELTKEEAARLAADGPRYKALGNSMAVPCMRWIGRRIELYGKS